MSVRLHVAILIWLCIISIGCSAENVQPSAQSLRSALEDISIQQPNVRALSFLHRIAWTWRYMQTVDSRFRIASIDFETRPHVDPQIKPRLEMSILYIKKGSAAHRIAPQAYRFWLSRNEEWLHDAKPRAPNSREIASTQNRMLFSLKDLRELDLEPAIALWRNSRYLPPAWREKKWRHGSLVLQRTPPFPLHIQPTYRFDIEDSGRTDGTEAHSHVERVYVGVDPTAAQKVAFREANFDQPANHGFMNIS